MTFNYYFISFPSVIELLHSKKECVPDRESDVDQDTPENCGDYCSADGKQMFSHLSSYCYCVLDHENCQLKDSKFGYDLYKIHKIQGNSYRLHYPCPL